MANHGMFIFPFSPMSLFPAAARATNHVMTSSTGTSIITRIIFTIMAMDETDSPMALPAPTTCATSWMVLPANIPICSGVRSKTPLR